MRLLSQILKGSDMVAAAGNTEQQDKINYYKGDK